jgi:hypothetical protein
MLPATSMFRGDSCIAGELLTSLHLQCSFIQNKHSLPMKTVHEYPYHFQTVPYDFTLMKQEFGLLDFFGSNLEVQKFTKIKEPICYN